MKKERMNEKMIVSRTFAASFPQKEQNMLLKSWNIVKDGLGQKSRNRAFRALRPGSFPRESSNYFLTYEVSQKYNNSQAIIFSRGLFSNNIIIN